MDPILDKARAAQNAWSGSTNAMPGFKGYRESELRRDADRLQREHICRAPGGRQEGRSTDVAGRLTRGGEPRRHQRHGDRAQALDKVANRDPLRGRGYSGFFDAVKVDETILAKVYAFDMGLVEDVDGVRAAAAAATGASDPRAAVQDLIGRIDALDARLSERENVLRGIK